MRRLGSRGMLDGVEGEGGLGLGEGWWRDGSEGRGRRGMISREAIEEAALYWAGTEQWVRSMLSLRSNLSSSKFWLIFSYATFCRRLRMIYLLRNCQLQKSQATYLLHIRNHAKTLAATDPGGSKHGSISILRADVLRRWWAPASRPTATARATERSQ